MTMEFILFVIILIDLRVFASDYGSEMIEERLRELSGFHLRFSASHLPPYNFMKRESNGTFSYRGFQVDISDFLAQLINITYSFVNTKLEEESQVGLKEAAVNLLLRHEVDIVTLTMGLNLGHFSRMDISCPLTMVPLGMMVPWPEEETRLLAPIKPFQPVVWSFLFTVLVTSTFAFVWVPGLYFKFIEKPQSNNTSSITNYKDLNNAAVYIITTLTNHAGKWTHYKQLSFRILLATWCLSALVLANAYSGTLFSFLVAPKLQPVTKSFDELAYGYPQRLKLLSEKNQFLAESIFLPAKSGSFKILGDSLRENPDTLFTNRIKGFQLMSTGRFAYVAPEPLLYAFMDEGNKRAGYCRFTVSTMNLPIASMYSVLAFHKHWRYTDAVNFKMQRGWESGLYKYWARKYEPNIDNCRLDHYQNEMTKKVRNLSLIDLSGPFAFLLLGVSLSFLVFLLELIWHRIINKRKITILELSDNNTTLKNNELKEEEESHVEENHVEV